MNPHPIDYHRILAQITLEHPNGGADLHAEMARRFMEVGGIAGSGPNDMPVDPFQGPPPSHTETPAQTNARDARTRASGQQMSGEPGAQPVPGSYDQEHPDSQAASYDQGQRLGQEQGSTAQPTPAPGIPSVPTQPGPQAAQKTVPHETGGSGGGQLGDRQGEFKQGQESIRQQAGVTEQAGRARSDLEAQTARMQQGQVDDNLRYQSQLEAQKQHALARQMALIEQSAGTIDPKKYWGSLDGFHSVTARISMVLGALGGGLQGQGNTSPIVSQIQQNIAMQKDQFERDGKAANAYGDIYRNLTSDGLSHAQATEATTKMMESISARQVEGMAARFAGPMAQAKVGQDLANYGMDSRKKDAETMASLSQAHSSNIEAKMKSFQMDQMKQQADYLKSQGLPIGTSLANQVADDNGNRGFAPDDKQAEAYDKETLPSQQLLETLNEIKQKRDKGVIANAGDLQAMRGRLEQNLAAMGEMKESKRNEDILKGMSGDPTQLYNVLPGSNWDKHMRSLEEIARRNIGTSKKVHPGIRFQEQPQVPEQKR